MAFDLTYDTSLEDSQASLNASVVKAIEIMTNDNKVSRVVITNVAKPDFNVIVVRN